MEQKASYANDQVADKTNEKNGVVTVADAIRDPFVRQIYER